MHDKSKFLFDENIELTIISHFIDAGYDIVSVANVLHGANDKMVLEHAVREERIVVTFDKDFADLVFHAELPHAGIVLLRTDGLSSKHTAVLLEEAIKSLSAIPQKAFIVVSKDKVRVRE